MSDFIDFPIPENEVERLQELTKLDFSTSKLGFEFDQLSWLAAKICDAEIALINFIDVDTQWTKSNFGIDLDKMERCDSVCQYTIMNNQFYEVEDLTKDERFRDVWYVVDKPNLKFYGGFPLSTSNNLNIGAICVLDTQPKKLNDVQIKALQIISKSIVTRIESLRQFVELRQSNASNIQLMRIISHDLRNPISGIIGLIDIILEMEEFDTEFVKELLDMIKKTAHQMQFYTTEILDDGLDSSISEIHVSKIELVDLIQKSVMVYAPFARTKEIDIIITYSSEQVFVISDQVKLKQIINNLLSNALKFTKKGGNVTVEVDRTVESFSIKISDSGIGIPEDVLEKLFDNSPDILRTGTDGERSTGLGLQTIKTIVSSLNGTIEVESEVGIGTSFTINFS